MLREDKVEFSLFLSQLVSARNKLYFLFCFSILLLESLSTIMDSRKSAEKEERAQPKSLLERFTGHPCKFLSVHFLIFSKLSRAI